MLKKEALKKLEILETENLKLKNEIASIKNDLDMIVKMKHNPKISDEIIVSGIMRGLIFNQISINEGVDQI